MSLYPIFLKLEGKKILVVGGGQIAEEKLFGLLRSATDITVVSPQLSEKIQGWADQGLLKHDASEYRPGMVHGYFLVIAATDSKAVNQVVYQEAREAGILSNAVDDPQNCDFYAPAVVSRGEFQIAVSTGGNSPALAQKIRKELEQQYGPEYQSWTSWLGRVRAGLLTVLPRGEKRKELLHLLAHTKPMDHTKSVAQ